MQDQSTLNSSDECFPDSREDGAVSFPSEVDADLTMDMGCERSREMAEKSAL